MPPITPVPIACRAFAPAPVEMASGSHAEDERERRHQDRPQAEPRRVDDGVAERAALLLLGDRELDDQDRVLGRQANDGDQADLEDRCRSAGRAATRPGSRRARRAARRAARRPESTSSRRARRGRGTRPRSTARAAASPRCPTGFPGTTGRSSRSRTRRGDRFCTMFVIASIASPELRPGACEPTISIAE